MRTGFRTHAVVGSPVGPLTLVAVDGGLAGLYMTEQRHLPPPAVFGERDDDGEQFAAAADQLRDMLAIGASRAVLLETDGREWGPIATAAAIVDALRAGGPYDLILFGNEAADTGGFQVGVRVAHLLGLPCVTGIKHLEVSGGRLRAGREYRGTEEAYDLPLPAVVSVKEGINLPRYPSLPGRLRAKRAAIERIEPVWHAEGLRKERLRVPAAQNKRAEILGTGASAVPALVALLDDLGVLP